MDTKKLIDDLVEGVITQEQFDAESAKLEPEAREQLEKDAKEKLPSAVEKLKGVRRGIEKISTEKKEEDNTLATKIRQENLADASSEVFEKFGIKTKEEQDAFMEGFKKFDTGSVNVKNIVTDMKKYYVSTKPDEFLDLAEQKRQREAEAEELTAQNAGANGSGGGGAEQKKVSKDVKAIMDASAKAGRVLTVEEATKRLELMRNKGHLDR